MSDFTLKQNDTVPIQAELTASDGSVEDLTGASVQFLMKTFEGTVVINSAATIDDAGGGVVSYNWAATDTEDAGSFLAEFEVTHNEGTTDEYVETYPRDDYLEVRIMEDIA